MGLDVLELIDDAEGSSELSGAKRRRVKITLSWGKLAKVACCDDINISGDRRRCYSHPLSTQPARLPNLLYIPCVSKAPFPSCCQLRP